MSFGGLIPFHRLKAPSLFIFLPLSYFLLFIIVRLEGPKKHALSPFLILGNGLWVRQIVKARFSLRFSVIRWYCMGPVGYRLLMLPFHCVFPAPFHILLCRLGSHHQGPSLSFIDTDSCCLWLSLAHETYSILPPGQLVRALRVEIE